MKLYAAGLLATLGVVLLSSAGFAGTIDYYRFENSLADSGSGGNTPVLNGTLTFSSNVPTTTIPQTGQADTASLSLDSSTYLTFSYDFPFDTLTDATLEFYVDPASVAQEEDIFWTTTGTGDQDRFNIGIAADGAIFMDYRDPSGVLHQLGDTPTGEITADQWNFVAIVKSGDTYSIYVNNNSPVTTTDSSPNLPDSTGWTINGRSAEQPETSCCQFSGLIDEVRLSNDALNSSEFLDSSATAVPEGGTFVLFGLGLIALGMLRFRTVRT
jgi:hypothetical protein